MTAEWKPFNINTLSGNEIVKAEHGTSLRYMDGHIRTFEARKVGINELVGVTHYLICEPLPHLDMRIEHACTGRPVEEDILGEWERVGYPRWLAHTVYRFAPPVVAEPRYEYEYVVFLGSSEFPVTTKWLADDVDSLGEITAVVDGITYVLRYARTGVRRGTKK